ncbi:MAG TPA: PIN domain-containing protein [Terracidiphilus sp.]|nr:PIN domain-containing protein [Terracidiphilus sp.]
MSAKVFIDTNVLVYAHDIDAGRKQQKALEILRDLMQKRSVALSMQVLQEFYSTVTRKLASRVPKDEARAIVEDFSHWCVETTPEEIKRAFQIEDKARIGFWDAMIVAAALRSGATHILSEDLNPGQAIAGVQIENPFALP